MRRLFPFAAVAFVAVALLLGGCATGGGANTVTLPRLPAWRAPVTDTPLVSALGVSIQAQALLPGVPVNYADNTYTVVSDKWLDEYLTWTWSASKADGITYTPESFDCDDFSVGFSFFAGRAAARAGVKAAPLIAWVVVQFDATQRHELIGVATDNGIFIVEPQPDAGPFRKTALAKYTKPILGLTLGGITPPAR